MGLAIVSLVAELAERRGELITLVPDAPGSTTTLICGAFADYFVEDVDRLNAWVYCPLTSTNAGANIGLSRRASTYHQSGTYVDFPRAWPAAVSNAGGAATYYMTTRNRWDRLRSAVNAGIADISVPFAAPLTESIVIVAHQYQYQLPALSTSIVPSQLEEISVSVSTSAQNIGYPYATATPYNWRIYNSTDPSTGVTSYLLQFETLPMVGSLVRLYGRAPLKSTGQASDTAFVACDPQYDDIVQEYLLMHASYMLAKWDVDTEPVGKALYALQIATAALQEARAKMLERMPRGPNARIVVPGKGDGRMLAYPGGDPSDFLAAHNTLH